VQQLLDDGTVLRTHVLRATWHFVLPDDIRWLVELTAPRLRRTYQSAQQSLAMTEDQLHRSRTVILETLSGARSLSRSRLAEGLPSVVRGQRRPASRRQRRTAG
jgi:hypothetical protein